MDRRARTPAAALAERSPRPAAVGPRRARRGGRGLVAMLIACAAGVLALLALTRSLDRDAARAPEARPAPAAAAPEREPAAELAPAPVATPPDPPATAGARSAGTEERTMSRVELVAVAPPGWAFTGSIDVAVRRTAGELVREVSLPADAPRAELTLADGEYVLEARHAGPPQLAGLPVPLSVAGDATEPVRLALTLTRVLAGTVADENGRATVDVPLALELGDAPVATARTGPDGGFAFPPLPEGEYALVVGDPLGPLVPRRTVRIDASIELLEVVVPPLLDLVVRVLDAQGLALPDVEVEGVGEGGGRLAGTTDARGELHAYGLPPGNYRAFARDPVLGRGTVAFALSATTPAEPVEIRLVPRR